MDQRWLGYGPYADSPYVADEAGDWPAEGVTCQQIARAHELAPTEGDANTGPP